MRLLQNAGFLERACCAPAQSRTRRAPPPALRMRPASVLVLLPFANQRFPEEARITTQLRREARARLGFDSRSARGIQRTASFGFVDPRTKMTDVVLESAAWLTQWGHRVSLHLAGAASADDEESFARRAREAGLRELVTGFLDDAAFRDYLLAVDVGLQLRIGPLLGVSGPLSDLAAYGTSSVASSGLAIDVDTPDYVDRLPDDVTR